MFRHPHVFFVFPQVNEGTNITADSFYSSQGRFDPSFNDENDRLISEVLKKYPKAITMDAWRSMGNNG